MPSFLERSWRRTGSQRCPLLRPRGFPYGSVVSYVDDTDGAPVILVSEMAEHTVNARGDDRVSMLIVDIADGGDPLGRPRLTLVGRLTEVADPSTIRNAYLDKHPYASYYVDFTDFGFWRLNVEQCRYVGGFGHMSWVTGDGYGAAEVDPLAGVAAGVVEHMNDDHGDANLLYVQALAELPGRNVCRDGWNRPLWGDVAGRCWRGATYGSRAVS